MKDFTVIISSCKFGQLSISEANKMINEHLEAKNLQQAPVMLSLLAVEYGYKSCEKGNNLEKTISDFEEVVKSNGA